MRNDHKFSRRVVIAGFAAIPALTATTAVNDADMTLIALGRKPNMAGQTPDQTGSSEWPNAATTGVPAGAKLTPVGTVTSRSNGQIIAGQDVNGDIVVNHAGVTIRHCRVRGVMHIKGVNCTIERSTIIGTPAWNSGISNVNGHNMIVRRCDISGVENGMWCQASGVLIEDNYFHDMIPYNSVSDPHIDGIQIPGDAGVRDVMIRHNNLDLATNVNSCIAMKDATNVDIVNNRLTGGTYIIYFEGNTTGCHVTGNVFGSFVFGRVNGTAARAQIYAGNTPSVP
jgi:hypothetical protein